MDSDSDVTNAKRKIENIIKYDNLPLTTDDSRWERIEKAADLSFDELSALMNDRCHCKYLSFGTIEYIFSLLYLF